MKFIFSQMAFFLSHQGNRKNLGFVVRFIIFTILLIALYSTLFHYFMDLEGRGDEFSTITGLYWTITVMSTLGFGDITFSTDLGKLFSIVVLMSGIVMFMIVLPFTFIRFVYTPWLEAKANAMTPRELPSSVKKHVIIAGMDNIAINIADKFIQYGIPYVILVQDSQKAIELLDNRYRVVLGELDEGQSYINAGVERASFVLALYDDLKNTTIATTVRGVSKSVPLAASANLSESREILILAGCNEVVRFAYSLGESIARRVFNGSRESNIIARFEGLCVAESPARHSPFIGKPLKDLNIRSNFGLNIAAILHDNHYSPAGPDTVIEKNDALLLAGTEETIKKYDEGMAFENDAEEEPPVLVMGGGRVGTAVAETLANRHIPYLIVEQRAALIPEADSKHYVLGNAAQIDILIKAGIEKTHTVVVTTHNDDLNIYLTIYCRKLRPDVTIISRATHDRNVDAMYNAGANLVMSQATMAANLVTNLLTPGRVFMLTEGFNIFRVFTPTKLVGTTLAQSGISSETGCNVIAIRNSDGKLETPPRPDSILGSGAELILIGTAQAEKAFMENFS